MRAVICLTLISAALAAGQKERSSPRDSKDQSEFLKLEEVWNDAHKQGDWKRLDDLWAEELVVTVPAMPVFDKARSLQIWRSGHMKFERYETSEIKPTVFGDATVVTGRVQRKRNMQGKDVEDDWRFTKVYIRRDGRWQVVAWHASQT